MERPKVGPKGETRGFERVKSHEFSRMGSGSAWEDRNAEEDLGVPGGRKIPAVTDSCYKVTGGAIRTRIRN